MSTGQLRVLIDEGLTTKGNLTGIGQQGINLFKHLKKITECDITNFWYLTPIPRGLRKFSYIAAANVNSLINNYNVIHYQNYYVPKWKGNNKKVVTIHDLGVFKYPETVPTIYIKYNQHVIRNAVKRADAIITPTESVKTEIREIFQDVNPNNIHVSYNGIRETFWESKPKGKFFHSHDLKPFSYFFYLGYLTRRKNLKFLIETFLEAKGKKIISNDTKLVLVGRSYWGIKDFDHLIDEAKGIIRYGYLSDEDIVDLYHYSKAMIFPSIYEGFGMPLIEAMKFKIPIIISNIATSVEINEMHGNNMYIFNLGDKIKLSSLLEEFDADYMKKRENLDYGDLSLYNFDNVARRHFDIYNTLI